MNDREAQQIKQRLARMEAELQRLLQPTSKPRIFISQDDMAIFKTPTGGIPALTGTSTPWTPGVAEGCIKCEYYLDGSTVKIREISGDDTTVYNMTKTAVEELTLIQAKRINGYWTVDVEDCGGA